MKESIALIFCIALYYNESVAQWTQFSSPFSAINSISFLDDMHGYAMGYNYLYETVDGGATWNDPFIFPFDNFGPPSEVAAFEPNTIWVKSGGLTLGRSVNNQPFQTIHYVYEDGFYYFEDIGNCSFIDADRAVFITDELYVSGSGGNPQFDTNNYIKKSGQFPNFVTWHNDSIGVKDVFFLNDSLGWFITYPGRVYRTQGAQGYQFIYDYAEDGFKKIYFLNPSIGFIILHDGNVNKILRTENGGVAWEVVLENFPNELNDVSFFSEFNGWAVGENGTLLQSIDGGFSWFEYPNSINDDLTEIDIVNSQLGFIAAGQFILKYNCLPTSNFIVDTICTFENFTFADTTYVGPGTYHYFYLNNEGCDSIIQINLEPNFVPQSSFTDYQCDGEIYAFGENELITPFMGEFNIVDSAGCDSIVHVNIIALPVPPVSSISQVGSNTLQAIFGNFEYQWYLNGTLISGATNSTYTTNVSGIYTVEVTTSSTNCSTFSDPFSYSGLLFTGLNPKSVFVISPNPATTMINIQTDDEDFSAAIMDVNGRTLIKIPKLYPGNNIVDIKYIQKGLYFIQFTSSTQSFTERVIKL